MSKKKLNVYSSEAIQMAKYVKRKKMFNITNCQGHGIKIMTGQSPHLHKETKLLRGDAAQHSI